jgi:His-Xaa-Ser system protein HxsD
MEAVTSDSGDLPSFETEWSKTVVPLEALERALYALADRATGTIRDHNDLWVITIQPRNAKADLDSLGHALRQEVNDQTLRVKIAERTDPIRNLVFALAFSRSGLVESHTDK